MLIYLCQVQRDRVQTNMLNCWCVWDMSGITEESRYRTVEGRAGGYYASVEDLGTGYAGQTKTDKPKDG